MGEGGVVPFWCKSRGLPPTQNAPCVDPSGWSRSSAASGREAVRIHSVGSNDCGFLPLPFVALDSPTGSRPISHSLLLVKLILAQLRRVDIVVQPKREGPQRPEVRNFTPRWLARSYLDIVRGTLHPGRGRLPSAANLFPSLTLHHWPVLPTAPSSFAPATLDHPSGLQRGPWFAEDVTFGRLCSATASKHFLTNLYLHHASRNPKNKRFLQISRNHQKS